MFCLCCLLLCDFLFGYFLWFGVELVHKGTSPKFVLINQVTKTIIRAMLLIDDIAEQCAQEQNKKFRCDCEMSIDYGNGVFCINAGCSQKVRIYV